MTENLENLSQLKNITIEELCSVPCDDKEAPKIICDLCKDPLAEDKGSTIGEICANDPCFGSLIWCNFCASIRPLQRPSVPSSSSEISLGRTEKISVLAL